MGPNALSSWFQPTTLGRRRRRIGYAIVSIIIAYIALFSLLIWWGMNAQTAIIMGISVMPTLSILAGQWVSVGAKIAEHGPDRMEELAPGQKAKPIVFVIIILAALLAVAIVGVLAMQVPHFVQPPIPPT